MRPQKIIIAGGRRQLVSHDSRSEEYKSYNQSRWNYDKEVMKFYRSKAWRETSKLVLMINDYVCAMCGGEATMTDHIIPVKVDWNKRLDLSNLQASCKRCNDAKAKREKNLFKKG